MTQGYRTASWPLRIGTVRGLAVPVRTTRVPFAGPHPMESRSQAR